MSTAAAPLSPCSTQQLYQSMTSTMSSTAIAPTLPPCETAPTHNHNSPGTTNTPCACPRQSHLAPLPDNNSAYSPDTSPVTPMPCIRRRLRLRTSPNTDTTTRTPRQPLSPHPKPPSPMPYTPTSDHSSAWALPAPFSPTTTPTISTTTSTPKHVPSPPPYAAPMTPQPPPPRTPPLPPPRTLLPPPPHPPSPQIFGHHHPYNQEVQFLPPSPQHIHLSLTPIPLTQPQLSPIHTLCNKHLECNPHHLNLIPRQLHAYYHMRNKYPQLNDTYLHTQYNVPIHK